MGLSLRRNRLSHGVIKTIFGPLQASVYVGRFYLVFSERRQVLELTRHFDGLVREADFEAKQTPRFIEAMSVPD